MHWLYNRFCDTGYALIDRYCGMIQLYTHMIWSPQWTMRVATTNDLEGIITQSVNKEEDKVYLVLLLLLFCHLVFGPERRNINTGVATSLILFC